LKDLDDQIIDILSGQSEIEGEIEDEIEESENFK
jgi:hypothetical protein